MGEYEEATKLLKENPSLFWEEFMSKFNNWKTRQAKIKSEKALNKAMEMANNALQKSKAREKVLKQYEKQHKANLKRVEKQTKQRRTLLDKILKELLELKELV